MVVLMLAACVPQQDTEIVASTVPPVVVEGTGNAVERVRLAPGRWEVTARAEANQGRYFGVVLSSSDCHVLVASDVGSSLSDDAMVDVGNGRLGACDVGQLALEVDAVGSWSVVAERW